MKIIGVTNRKLCDDFYGRIAEISMMDLEYLILREKDLSYDDLKIMAKEIKKILVNSSIKLIINGNIKVAKDVEAGGIQLSFNHFSEGRSKDYEGIIGVSIHSLREAIDGEALGASYLLYGHVFETDCKKGVPPRGLVELKEICSKVKIPVYAIGGINEKNYNDVLDSGAYGVAIMSSLMKQPIFNDKII
ncbi:thiamine phosphate synthase [Clostridium vincentii]|uniref:Regulatory protein TenI n=1 Tax=Clostridium vincentii TaxID=52704 RepID=A0A2T0BBH9_9CLOT|nr:thiamine phosphate synthase [Clostridium vincentii]PRR81250.1 Regulatory protein TenI [Clostridium vincentii]